MVRGQRRGQGHELPELVVGGRHAGEGRAAERAQGSGALLLLAAVAEDEGQTSNASLSDVFFFLKKRGEEKSELEEEKNRTASLLSLSVVVSLP